MHRLRLQQPIKNLSIVSSFHIHLIGILIGLSGACRQLNSTHSSTSAMGSCWARGRLLRYSL
ncbi:hypothetical protein BDV26DRAFT_260273 [Aspergillus bertholletiae]|uniref:Uncharacterized protein n=1 Tax=Aspergillus bertholletiae TaxID=1226010 RepID=A0A5N7BBG7_9EURO|nr:hypothetical protein BDV26DRAFT_260273 [Aspergillus bertholletiae]